MKVSLISFNPDAMTLLLGTKNTRLSSDDDPAKWSDEKRAEHLAYMRDTIKSSWEFVDYVFKIEGVTRAFTHQFVRTRTGSYAQQSTRVIDASHQPVAMPKAVADNDAWREIWERGAREMMAAYSRLIELGAPIQDARGLLPTNITTSIVAKFNLRTLHDMAKLRLCTRTQDEYQRVFREMRAAVVAVHPWAEDFLDVHCVATGTCAFPRYGRKECPVYLPEMERGEVSAKAKQIFWATNYAAQPIAKDGKAM